MNAGPIPVFPQGANDEPRYDYKEWPAWRYREDGKGQIFNNPEEVPDGWYTLDELNELNADAIINPGAPKAQQDRAEELGLTAEDDEKDETDPSLLKAEEQPRVLTADQRKAAVDKLRDENSQKDLVTMLELMNEDREDEIEFSGNWPKQKLAETIVDNGGPLEAE